METWSRWCAGALSVGSVRAVRDPLLSDRISPRSRVLGLARRGLREREEHAGVGVAVVMMSRAVVMALVRGRARAGQGSASLARALVDDSAILVVLLTRRRVMSCRHDMDVPQGLVRPPCRPGVGHHHRQCGEEGERQDRAQR